MVCVRICNVMLSSFLCYYVLCGIIWCVLAYVILRLVYKVMSYLSSLS